MVKAENRGFKIIIKIRLPVEIDFRLSEKEVETCQIYIVKICKSVSLL